jgi:hypothetical protein
MLTTITRIALTLAIAGSTYAACDRHASAAQSLACDVAALARAEAGAVTAERAAFETLDPAESRVARELVTAAVEQLRAYRALCSVPGEGQADPFEDQPKRWQDDLGPGDLDATAMVLDLPARLDALQAELARTVRP